MISFLLSTLSPSGESARLPILTFHRVPIEEDWMFPGEATAARFEQICRWLRGWFKVLPLDTALTRLMNGDLPAGACAITFDDGYADNHDVALPILQKLGLTATFFIATGYSDGGCMWNDIVLDALRRTFRDEVDLSEILAMPEARLALRTRDDRRMAAHRIIDGIKYEADERRMACALRCAAALGVQPGRNLMMTPQQVQAMARGGMSLGAHTVRHPILKDLPVDRVRAELKQSRAELESLIQTRIGLFAYPNGRPDVDYDVTTVAVVRDLGFDAAVTTSQGVATRASDRYQVPRIMPWAPDRWRFAWQLAGALGRNAGQEERANSATVAVC